MWPKKECEFCGGKVLPFRKTARFCSRSCSSKWQARRVNEEYPVGARVVKPEGYILLKLADGEWVLEHRHVMAERLGRKLDSNEHVHHINGDRSDNRPDNLQLRQGRHGKGVVMQCLCCGSYNVQAVELAEAS